MRVQLAKPIVAGVAAILTCGLMGAPAGAAGAPTGQRMVGSTTFNFTTMSFQGGGGTIEPAYDDANGSTIYIFTPNGPKVHPNDHNVAPLYLPVYPTGSTVDPSTLDCIHVGADNCPDHGPLVAGGVEAALPSVYGNGVLGHDHLLGLAKTGGDFNVIWEPVLVLFTSVAASDEHVTTLQQINQLQQSHDVVLVPMPALDFHCSVVSAAAYNRGTPAPTIPTT
jgi:hypothetical protein